MCRTGHRMASSVRCLLDFSDPVRARNESDPICNTQNPGSSSPSECSPTTAMHGPPGMLGIARANRRKDGSPHHATCRDRVARITFCFEAQTLGLLGPWELGGLREYPGASLQLPVTPLTLTPCPSSAAEPHPEHTISHEARHQASSVALNSELSAGHYGGI